MTKVIEASGLVKRYGPLVAVDDVSFTVDQGEVFVLLGPNGAGKTTTVEILEGLRRADEGRASIHDLPAGSRSLTKLVGVMPQESDLWAGIRTEEALRLFASFYRAAEDPTELVERLGLNDARRTAYRRLSGGERRRLSFGLALIGRPDVLFLDEPTAEMDVEGRAVVRDLIVELRARGCAIVLTTHLLDEAERLADRVGILRRGRLVALGSPAELAGRASANVTFTTATTVDADLIRAKVGVSVIADGPNTYRLDAPPSAELVASLARVLADAGVLVRRIEIGPQALEDVYLELTR